jgi:hypothetical protein
MVLQDGCEYCGKLCINHGIGTSICCKVCLINNLKRNFIICWTSGNKKIDELIQEMQLINEYSIKIVEWIPYSQFKDIKEIGRDDSTAQYSAIWMDGPLKYGEFKKSWERTRERNPNEKVVLKCLFNSQNITNEFLNEV